MLLICTKKSQAQKFHQLLQTKIAYQVLIKCKRLQTYKMKTHPNLRKNKQLSLAPNNLSNRNHHKTKEVMWISWERRYKIVSRIRLASPTSYRINFNNSQTSEETSNSTACQETGWSILSWHLWQTQGYTQSLANYTRSLLSPVMLKVQYKRLMRFFPIIVFEGLPLLSSMFMAMIPLFSN